MKKYSDKKKALIMKQMLGQFLKMERLDKVKRQHAEIARNRCCLLISDAEDDKRLQSSLRAFCFTMIDGNSLSETALQMGISTDEVVELQKYLYGLVKPV